MENAFKEFETIASQAVVRAQNTETAMLAVGFYQGFRYLADLVEEELAKKELELKKTREKWNARGQEARG